MPSVAALAGPIAAGSSQPADGAGAPQVLPRLARRALRRAGRAARGAPGGRGARAGPERGRRARAALLPHRRAQGAAQRAPAGLGPDTIRLAARTAGGPARTAASGLTLYGEGQACACCGCGHAPSRGRAQARPCCTVCGGAEQPRARLVMAQQHAHRPCVCLHTPRNRAGTEARCRRGAPVRGQRVRVRPRLALRRRLVRRPARGRRARLLGRAAGCAHRLGRRPGRAAARAALARAPRPDQGRAGAPRQALALNRALPVAVWR